MDIYPFAMILGVVVLTVGIVLVSIGFIAGVLSICGLVVWGIHRVWLRVNVACAKERHSTNTIASSEP